jgi:hypothetical protein
MQIEESARSCTLAIAGDHHGRYTMGSFACIADAGINDYGLKKQERETGPPLRPLAQLIEAQASFLLPARPPSLTLIDSRTTPGVESKLGCLESQPTENPA